MSEFSEKPKAEFWNELYKTGTIGWDIGYIATPIKEYFAQLKHKDYWILIPGAGNGHEAEYLYLQGCKNIYILDFAEEAIQNFKSRLPYFPDNQIIWAIVYQTAGL